MAHLGKLAVAGEGGSCYISNPIISWAHKTYNIFFWDLYRKVCQPLVYKISQISFSFKSLIYEVQERKLKSHLPGFLYYSLAELVEPLLQLLSELGGPH